MLEYAKLYELGTGRLAQNCEQDNLVMGPETARRATENDDNCAVTVICITYNHESYIRQALDSFLMQQTNFNYKIFVGEDHGPDHTADIVREYASLYPHKIFAFCREENMGAQRNLVDLCLRANSPYIAFCEGDDYWIDKYKLQKQYDYMQNNPKIRMCYTRTEILAPANWHLNGYYRHNNDGKMIIPECTPGFTTKDFYTVADFAKLFPNHTSSAFYRWNYDLEIPNWYYDGLIGDTPMTMLQMGRGKAVYLSDITSVYRRSDVGVFMHHSTQEHFLATRLDYVRLLSGVQSYFYEHYANYYGSELGARIGREISNYISAVQKTNDWDLLYDAVKRYPKQFANTLLWYRAQSNKYSTLENKLGGRSNINFLLRNIKSSKKSAKFCQYAIGSGIKIQKIKERLIRPILRVKASIRAMPTRISYWKNTCVHKQENLWIITSFRHKGYVDNSMYFYEYILAYHPEIQIVWVTTDQDVIDKLYAENKPVIRMDSKEGIALIAKAAIAITDHFACTDFPAQYGFNDNTKVVQLWHGVGFKSMGDGKTVKNTAERGVVYSYDILPQPNDNAIIKAVKHIKYWFRAPYRELFENYFMFVCPGQERVEKIGRIWNMKESSFFMAGHPRDIETYQQCADISQIKIMYAPTYRMNTAREKMLIHSVIENAAIIQSTMELINGTFYLRMHPHTWRDYEYILSTLEERFDRIVIDREKDVYRYLGTFHLMITDYSSIGLDLARLDRPIIFFCPDYDWFIEHEAGFGVDFPSVIPGIMTSTWPETLEQVKLHIMNPTVNADLRHERIKYFFDPAVNGPNNSERIVQEIKRRLGI